MDLHLGSMPILGFFAMPLIDLLTRGYFPKELPRPIVTAPFANAITSAAALPGDFAKTASKNNKLGERLAFLIEHAARERPAGDVTYATTACAPHDGQRSGADRYRRRRRLANR